MLLKIQLFLVNNVLNSHNFRLKYYKVDFSFQVLRTDNQINSQFREFRE